jgi:hypothetical protein
MSAKKGIQPDENVLENKNQRIQKQILQKYWFGWSGNYGHSKKKI